MQKSDNPSFLPQNIVFIDSQIENYQFLVSGIYAGVNVVVIPQNQDGIEVITTHLEKYINYRQNLEAIHIFSHGSPGSLKLGNIFLNQDTIKLYKNQIKKWQAALKITANILLYGCHIAAGIGQNLVHKLHQLTLANIAASVNLTGAYPGDWNLGFTTGKITAPQVLKPEVMATYNGTLGTITVTNINDSGAGSLRQAIAEASSGDTIEFDPSLANKTITLTSGQLEIDKNLTLDGGNAPNLTISGNSSSRVIDYQVSPNDNNLKTEPLIIKNLIIADGKTTENGFAGAGAGIRTDNDTELIVENSTFTNNTVSGRGGGAIYSGYNSKATIINSKFDNNDSSQAIENDEELSEHGGGAILIWSESELNIQDSEFTNNKGTTGGAINSLSSQLTVENSTFINNDSTAGSAAYKKGHGGAISTSGASFDDGTNSGRIEISNSLFEGNRAAGEGGALFLFGHPSDEIIVENSTIVNNYVIEGFEEYSIGGGIRAGNAEFTLTNSTVANNLALHQGGGLWVGGDATSTVINSTFSNNNAFPAKLDNNDQPIIDSDGNYVLDPQQDIKKAIGGAMNLNVPTTITNSTFANNHAGWWGGAFVGDESTTTTNSIYYNNTAGNPYGQANQTAKQLNDGGGNIQYPDQANINDAKITANVTIADPLIEELQEVDNVLVHPLLSGSPAIDSGVNTDVPNTDQLGNTRPVDGDNNGSSIIDIGAVEFIPEDSGDNIVTNNNDSGTGSLRKAIADANPGDTIEFDPSLANKTITLTSGQLEIDKNLTLDGGNAPNLTISGNSSSRVIDYQVSPNDNNLKTEPLIIKNLIIADGKTTENGFAGAGAGIRTDNDTELIVENSTFTNNTVSGRGGGAIYSGYNSKATIINSKFDNNDSSQAIENDEELSEHGGGAILIWSESELNIQDSEFTNNKGTTGGAINSLSSQLTVENSTFINNDSTAGSAAYKKGHGGAISTSGASFDDGTNSGRIEISNSLFEGNRAAGEGGALFLFGHPSDEIIVENSTIVNNYVIEGFEEYSIGGGIRAGNAEFTLTNSTVANNLALHQGGGLWVGGDATSTVINSTFSNNNAFPAKLDNNDQPIIDSDGNYVLDPQQDIKKAIGGAMNLNVPTTITNSTFANNHAGWWGGAFVGDESTTTTNSIYYNNTAGNPYGQANQTAKQLNDGGGNIQYPDQANINDAKITANVTIADPLIEELQEVDNVLVHPLLSGSPAIDSGVNTDVPNTDQLGNTRPVDGDNNGSSIIDIGAVEFIPTPGNYIVGDNLDNLLNGTSQNDNIDGLTGNDTLKGDAGNDTINGGDGLDILNGEQGTDILTGGSDSDRFLFDIGSQFNLADMGSDIITDFNSAELDKIVLSKTTFTSLDSVVGDGFTVTEEFAVVDNGAAVATSTAKIVYNSANGQIFYNPNGITSGFGDGGLFATLENQANLQTEDFVLTGL